MHVPLPVNGCVCCLSIFYVHLLLFLILFWFVRNKLLQSHCSEYYKLSYGFLFLSQKAVSQNFIEKLSRKIKK